MVTGRGRERLLGFGLILGVLGLAITLGSLLIGGALALLACAARVYIMAREERAYDRAYFAQQPRINSLRADLIEERLVTAALTDSLDPSQVL
jgi:hypothetical protein